MKALVTGAGGQLGRELVGAFARHEVVAADRATLDVADRHAVLAAVTDTRPDVIVHAAAWTAVDACESDPDRAFATNALATRHVAEAARITGAHVIYVSTDYVFDGTSSTPYTEWDLPSPRSVYGRSKLGGEQELDPGSAVVRTSWVVGRYGSNILKTVLRLLDGDATLTFVDDQHGCPTVAADLAVAIERLATSRLPGTFHVTNQGATTWYGFVQAVAEMAGAGADRVRPTSTAELDPPRPAPRPAMSVLDNAALRLQALPLLPDWQESVERLVGELTARTA
jgi:dTDP-4-dehydrorhamnose reductase